MRDVAALRRQPAAYSPIPLRAAWRAGRQGLRLAPDPRPDLERRLLAFYGRRHAALFGRGTEALEVALVVARRHAGAEAPVALPAYTCFDVAAAAVATGCRIALYDLDPVTLGPDLDSLRRVLAGGARTVVVTPLYGVPVEWEPVRALIAGVDGVDVEDAAQGHGAVWHGRPLGAMGTLAVLSFARGKGWTGGQGGALLSSDLVPGDSLEESTRAERGTIGEARVVLAALAQAVLGRPALYAVPAALPWLRLGEAFYREAPAPSAMTRAAAALLEATWDSSQREAATRRRHARQLLDALAGARAVRAVTPPAGGTPGFLRLPVRVAGGWAGLPDRRRALRLGVSPGYPAVLGELERVRPRLTNADARWPGAETLVRELVTLPTHSLLTSEELREIAGLLQAVRTVSGARLPPRAAWA